MDRPRLTSRGLGLLLTGLVALVGGTALGVTVVVQLGVLLLGVVAAGVGSLLWQAHRDARGGLAVERSIVPNPVTAGRAAHVTVRVTAGGTARLDTLQVAERAARELSGGRPLRARVRRERRELTLRYALSPDTRGRWAVGPLQVRRQDLFGCARRTGTLGERALVPVRPDVVDLRADSRALTTDTDRAVSGARTPAADDTLLRDYRPGDDLRRVHWPSSARLGEVLVRQDESSGRRPATVLLDLLPDGPTTEWAIRLAASAALALVRSGHHVRLLGGDVIGSGQDHHRPDVGGTAADALLDQTVDLRAPQDEDSRGRWLDAALATMRGDGGGGELVVAVVGPLPADRLRRLVEHGSGGHGWALVLDRDVAGEPSTEASATATALLRSGWTVTVATPGDDLQRCWERLLAAGRTLVTP